MEWHSEEITLDVRHARTLFLVFQILRKEMLDRILTRFKLDDVRHVLIRKTQNNYKNSLLIIMHLVFFGDIHPK